MPFGVGFGKTQQASVWKLLEYLSSIALATPAGSPSSFRRWLIAACACALVY